MQPTILTSVPVDSVDDALFIPRTLIVDHRALRSPKEALAALACDHAVVDAGRLVATYFTRDYFDLRCNERETKDKLHIHSYQRCILLDNTSKSRNDEEVLRKFRRVNKQELNYSKETFSNK